jgi:glycosyltransferase involved in cell wall biosynthesis
MLTEPLNSPPIVSVITPFLNGMRFMEEAVQSVLNQTYPHWELMLINDGSVDESPETAQTYVNDHPARMRYLEHPGRINLGQSASRNLGISQARGEYLAFLDVDDVWLPEKLEKQVHLLETYPEVAMTYGPYYLWHEWDGQPDANARDLKGDVAGGDKYDRVVYPPLIMRHYFEHDGNGLPVPSGVLVRRNAVDAVGGFEMEFPGMYDDEALFSKLALRYPVYLSKDSWDKYRQHSESFCAQAIRDGRWHPDPRTASPDRIRILDWLTRQIASSSEPHAPDLLRAARKFRERIHHHTNR